MNLQSIRIWPIIPLLLTLAIGGSANAGRITDYVMSSKHSQTTDGYFTTPQQRAARAYWDVYKIVDGTNRATLTIDQQVGFLPGTQTADIIVPDAYKTNNPVGIFIYFTSGDSAYMPTQFVSICSNLYLIGASPDMAGNSQHDMARRRQSMPDTVPHIGKRHRL